MSEYILQLEGVTKDYAGNPVLKGVDLNIKRGEIHALLGENGAGKSTLMNILFGMPVIFSTGGYQGKMLLDGQETSIRSPRHAIESGIGMVHQEFMLIPGFTATENIKLNREVSKKNLVSKLFGSSMEHLDVKQMRGDARKALDTVGLSIEEYARVKGMPIGYMQFIEIAREIDKENIKLLVFDEPTAVLTETEAQTLIAAMKNIAARGIAIIFITHRLDEVIQAADHITVLRDGQVVKTLAESNVIELAELMIGRKVEKLVEDDELARSVSDNIALSLEDFYVEMPGEEVKGLSIEVKEGEIYGIGGLAGQGKVGVANGVLGLYPSRGSVKVFGQPLKLSAPYETLKSGLAFVSEDRRGVGLLLDKSIEDNIAFSAMQINDDFVHRFGPLSQKNAKKIRTYAERMIKELDIRCTGGTQPVGRLSGGNQQKVCISRALALKPRILFVSEPTRGIDIGAKKLVLELLVEINKKSNVTIVMISSELVELRSICDKIAIVSEGKLSAILPPDASDADFGLAMTGYKKEGK